MFKHGLKVITYILVVSVLAFALHPQAIAEDATDFSVNVKESLFVSITTPTDWASGDIDTFLRNKVSIQVRSNNAAGFTASMTTKTPDTALTNTSKNTATLPTLSTSTSRSSFPANYWGYSLNDTDAGNNSSTYNALVGSTGTPITLLSSTTAASGSKDFYFGAKADVTKAAGTYTGTVVISVVTGVINEENPVTPTNPATPGPQNNTPNYNPAPTGGSSSGTTTYTYTNTGSDTNTTTTEISEGDNTSAYSGYTPPQGQTQNTISNISNNSALATGLATASSIAAASGIFFFVLAKRDKDDEEDEQAQILCYNLQT